MRTEFSIVFVIIATIVIGMGTGNHDVYAAKVTASSYSDGYSRGEKDASRDLRGGHGYDSSCPSGHTSVFCEGYLQGYDATWSIPKQSETYQDGFALGKSRAVQALQELHDGKIKQLDENDEGECPSTDKDFCSGLFDGWNKTVFEGTNADQRVD